MSAFYVTLVHFTKPTGDTIETGSSSISKCKEEPVVFSSKEATKWGAVRKLVQSHRNHALMCEDSGVITKSYHPFFTLHKEPSPASHHSILLFLSVIFSSLFDKFLFPQSSFSIPLFCSITAPHIFLCPTPVFSPHSRLCWGFSFDMWCYLNCSFGVKTSFKNKDRLTRNCQTTHTFQHPLNVFIPLRLSGHRLPPQTFLFHSQTFHIFTLTSAMQSFKLLPVTLIGSLNIKLTNPARTSLTRIMHWYKKVIEEKKERKKK